MECWLWFACATLVTSDVRGGIRSGDMLLDLKVPGATVQFLAAIEPQITLFLDSQVC